MDFIELNGNLKYLIGYFEGGKLSSILRLEVYSNYFCQLRRKNCVWKGKSTRRLLVQLDACVLHLTF